ncbi:MAG: hypothetical protein KDB27_18300, partial [Planctomycetales bacterium]|nr:hypothetical protein [Planctomycetales bacterium]
VFDASDLDKLATEIRSGDNDRRYDLDDDRVLDFDDAKVWVHDVVRSYIGDSNLDGQFNSADMVSVLKAGEYEDGIPKNSTWGTGDWDFDGEFDSSDFVVAFRDGGYERGPRGQAPSVPESGLSLFCWLFGFFALRVARPKR